MFREHAGESTDRASKFRLEVMGRGLRDLDCGADSCGPYRSMHNIIQGLKTDLESLEGIMRELITYQGLRLSCLPSRIFCSGTKAHSWLQV